MIRALINLTVIVIIFQGTLSKLNIPYVNQVDEILILLLFLYSVIRIISLKKLSKISLVILSILSLFNLIGLLSFFVNSQGSMLNVLLQMFLYSKFYLLIFALLNLPINDHFVVYIVNILKKIAIVSAPFMIINFLFPVQYPNLITTSFVDSIRLFNIRGAMGLFEHPSVAGTFYLTIMIICLFNYLDDNKKNSFFFSVLYTLLAIMTMKVKIIIATVVIIIFYIFLSTPRKFVEKIVLLTLPVLGILYLSKEMLISSFYKYIYIDSLGINSLTSARKGLLYASKEILFDYFPLGVGFSKFGSWYARINYSEYYNQYGINNIYGLRLEDPRFSTDTFWPAIMGETGIIGTIVYSVLLLYIIVKLLNNKNNFLGENNMYISLIALFIFVEAIIETVGEPIFNSAPQNIMIGFFVAIGLKEWNSQKIYKEKR